MDRDTSDGFIRAIKHRTPSPPFTKAMVTATDWGLIPDAWDREALFAAPGGSAEVIDHAGVGQIVAKSGTVGFVVALPKSQAAISQVLLWIQRRRLFPT